MHYDSVLLIRPPDTNITIANQNLPLPIGLGYLEQCLDKAGVSTNIYDMFITNSIESLINRVRLLRPKLIGYSINSYLYTQTYKIIESIKREFPDIITVVGGPHVSISKEKVLQECTHIDYGFAGEGEYPLIDFCKGAPIKEISGLIYRVGDAVLSNQKADYTNDLDNLGFPKYKGYSLDNYPNGYIPIITTRGCPYECTFCSVKNISGRRLRCRSAENVVSEIEYWYRMGRKRFSILDDSFSLNAERVGEICKKITERGLVQLSISCPTGLRADSINHHLLELLKKVGLKSLAIGVETGNKEVLKKVKKGETLETIKNAIKIACDMGIDVKLFFIIGLPGENKNTMEEAFALAKMYPVADVNFYHANPYPGTELLHWVLNHGRLLIDEKRLIGESNILDENPVFETDEFTREERIEVMKKAVTVEREITSKWIARKNRSEIMESDLLPTMRVSRVMGKALKIIRN